MAFEEFHDPRLVTLSLTLDAGRTDLGFYLDLAADLQASLDRPIDVLDIGCGTGALAVALAERGCHVTAVEPSPAMIAAARARPGAARVRWVDGDASALDLPDACVDLVTMTGHIPQVIPDETTWRTTLAAAARRLRPGGSLAFESRNPAARAWDAWTPDATTARVPETALGPVTTWLSVAEVTRDAPAGDATLRVDTEIHYTLEATGETLTSRNVLHFRTLPHIEANLSAAGLAIAHLYGDHARAPLTPTSPEFLVHARRH